MNVELGAANSRRQGDHEWGADYTAAAPTPLLFRCRRWLRRQVTATASGPLGRLYRALYTGAIKLVAWKLSRLPQTHSLYLRRGVAKGDLRPGISDLDFALVYTSWADSVTKSYSRLARWIPFVEKELDLYPLQSFSQLANSPAQRYRLAEAKETWKLLYGPDVLAGLPAWSAADLWPGMYRETQIWPALVIQHLVAHPYLSHDHVFRNAMSAKLLGELLRLEFAWFEGRLTFSRSQALTWTSPQHPWRVAIQQAEELHWGSPSPHFAEFAWREMLAWLDRFARQLAPHPYAAAAPFRGREILAGQQPLGEHAAALTTWARSQWGPDFLGAEFRHSLEFPLDQPPWLMRFQAPPSLQSIRRFHRRCQGSRLSPYLSCGGGQHAALSLLPLPTCDAMVLTAGRNPDFFAHGAGPGPLFWDFFPPRWGDLVNDATLSPADRARRFWMSTRLALTYVAARGGSLQVCHDPSRIVSQLSELGFGPPPDISQAQATTAYLRELWGRIRERAFKTGSK